MVEALPAMPPVRSAARTEAPLPLDAPHAPQTLEQTLLLSKSCQRCDLWRNATQTVFGEGPEHAPVMFVGEQPGDKEDRAGRPFVGPAGQLFQELLEEAGIDRTRCYVT